MNIDPQNNKSEQVFNKKVLVQFLNFFTLCKIMLFPIKTVFDMESHI